MKPYASVVLPTLNRHGTLPYALASVQAQTLDCIEILIVLDGAADECRTIAWQAARNDHRIRVLDMPKALGSGQANTDRAVKLAEGERIFYIDDDDLFLPHHVEKLGPLLETADIADSRVCSVDRHDLLHLGVAPGSSPKVRQMLGRFQLKMLYDTHIAHRKDAYGRYSSWVRQDVYGNDPVGRFFSGFANDLNCKWASTEEVTALSLHGAARRDMKSAEREREISTWADRARKPAELALALERADSAFNFFRLLFLDRPGALNMNSYLVSRSCYGDVGATPIERYLFGLFGTEPPDITGAVEIATRMAEAVESGYLFESVAVILFDAYGQDQATKILEKSYTEAVINCASCLAALSALTARVNRQLACEMADSACRLSPDSMGSLNRWRLSLTGT